MLSVEEALQRILVATPVLGVEECSLLEALGRALAEQVKSPRALPPWDNSAMDGFALRAQDTLGAGPETPVSLRVIGHIQAGQLPTVAVESGTAVRLMTGAPIPPGADVVVPFEETDQGPVHDGPIPGAVRVYRPLQEGQFVRRRGDDLKEGEGVLEPGQALGPAEIGLLASLGRDRVRVVRRPRVAILSTGSELVSPGQAIKAGEIYDGNTFSIAAAVERCGATPLIHEPVPDEPEVLLARVQECLSTADVVVTTAGVSMGDYDWVRTVVEQLGELDFWQINMKPGRPLAFGHLRGPQGTLPFFGLPGNPVSALVTFELLVRPALRKMMGHPPRGLPMTEAMLAEPVSNDDGRRFYARSVLYRTEKGLAARLTGPQGSHVLTSLVRADGLAIIPEDRRAMRAGERVTVLLLREPETLQQSAAGNGV